MCLQNCYFKGYIAFLCVDVVIRALNCKWQKPSLNKNRDLMAYVTGVDMSGRDVRIQDSNYVFRNVPAEFVSFRLLCPLVYWPHLILLQPAGMAPLHVGADELASLRPLHERTFGRIIETLTHHMTIWKGHKPEASFLQPTTTWILHPPWRVPFVTEQPQATEPVRKYWGTIWAQTRPWGWMILSEQLSGSKVCEASRSHKPKHKTNRK